MRLLGVTLAAPADQIAALSAFYSETLCLARSAAGFQIGFTELGFEPLSDGAAPFYHFALLVPGDRFTAALRWIRERVELLAIGASDDVVIRFEDWAADACYFHDPAGNIVELIAHEPFGASGRAGPFAPEELVGLSEIGLVGHPDAVAAALVGAGLTIFSGAVSSLAFIGEPTAALILNAPGWLWLPQRRPSQAWPVTVRVSAPDGRELELIHRPVDAVEQYLEIVEP